MYKYYYIQIVNNTCPYHLNEIFEFAPHCRIAEKIKNIYRTKISFRKTNIEQKAFSFVDPSL